MKVVVHRIDQGQRAGERVPLVTSSIKLDPYLSAWSMQRRQRLTPSSRETDLYELLVARLWAEIADINIEEKMVFGSCLDTSEIRDLSYHLHLRAGDLRKLAFTSPLDTAHLYDSFERVSASSVRRRYSAVYDYLSWLGAYGNRVLRRLGKDDPLLMAHRAERLRVPIKTRRGRPEFHPGSIAAELLSNRPAVRPSRLNSKPTAQLEEFGIYIALLNREAIWPGNADRAIRNELILKTFVETGLRSGELRQIKVSDIQPHGRKIVLRRRHNDPESRGRREANLKTHDGMVTLTSETWALLLDWLDIHDELTAQTSSPSDFLFISLDRNPANFGYQISAKGVDDVIKEVCGAAKLPSLSAHPLRHLRARRLAEIVREKKLTQEEARKAITYLMRWADDSDMLAHYLGDAADLAAEKSMRELQQEREASANALTIGDTNA